MAEHQQLLLHTEVKRKSTSKTGRTTQFICFGVPEWLTGVTYSHTVGWVVQHGFASWRFGVAGLRWGVRGERRIGSGVPVCLEGKAGRDCFFSSRCGGPCWPGAQWSRGRTPAGLAFALRRLLAHWHLLLGSWVWGRELAWLWDRRTPTEPSGLLSCVGKKLLDI